MASDDLYHKTDLQEIASTDGWVLQVVPITEKTNGGRVYVEEGLLRDIQEGSHSTGYIATSLYKLNHEIFNYPPIPISAIEYGLPQTIASAKNDRNIKISVARVWRQVGEPKDLEVTEILLKNNPDLLQK